MKRHHAARYGTAARIGGEFVTGLCAGGRGYQRLVQWIGLSLTGFLLNRRLSPGPLGNGSTTWSPASLHRAWTPDSQPGGWQLTSWNESHHRKRPLVGAVLGGSRVGLSSCRSQCAAS